VYAAACFIAVHEPDALHEPDLCQQQDDGQEGVQAQAHAVVASRPDQPCGRCDEGEQPSAEEGVNEPAWQQPHPPSEKAERHGRCHYNRCSVLFNDGHHGMAACFAAVSAPPAASATSRAAGNASGGGEL
jgi:hypothetical protein